MSEELQSKEQLQTELVRIKRELKAAYRTIDKLIRDNKGRLEEIEHLKAMLTSSVPVLVENRRPQQIIEIDMPAEEEIAELQLDRLRKAARERTLTLEETRQYDLLVKNKRLSREESTINLDSKQYKELNNAKLLEIAGQVDDGNKSEDK